MLKFMIGLAIFFEFVLPVLLLLAAAIWIYFNVEALPL